MNPETQQHKSRLNNEQKQTIKDFYTLFSDRELGEKIGCSTTAVAGFRKRNELKRSYNIMPYVFKYSKDYKTKLVEMKHKVKNYILNNKLSFEDLAVNTKLLDNICIELQQDFTSLKYKNNAPEKNIYSNSNR
jgi:hypothetical protein